MRMKYRDNMSPEEEARLLAECEALDQCYADEHRRTSAKQKKAVARVLLEEPFDPVRWGWIDRRGRP